MAARSAAITILGFGVSIDEDTKIGFLRRIAARNMSGYFWVVKSCILARVTHLSIQNLKNLDCNSH